jgi:hypothetical protein
MQLIYEKSGKPVKVGDRIKIGHLADKRIVEVAGIQEPRHFGSTGRVYVKPVVRGKVLDEISEYFPSVVGAIWNGCELKSCAGKTCHWPERKHGS